MGSRGSVGTQQKTKQHSLVTDLALQWEQYSYIIIKSKHILFKIVN